MSEHTHGDYSGEGGGFTAEEVQAAKESADQRFAESLAPIRQEEPEAPDEDPIAVAGEDGEVDWQAVDDRLDVLTGVHGPEAQYEAEQEFNAEIRALIQEYPELGGEAGGELVDAVRMAAGQEAYEQDEPDLALVLERDPAFVRHVWSSMLDDAEEESEVAQQWQSENKGKVEGSALTPSEAMFVEMSAAGSPNKLPWERK